MEAADATPSILSFRAMGSNTDLVVNGPSHLLGLGQERVEQLERAWSRFLHDSDITALNNSPEWVDVSADTLTLIDHALNAWRITGGAFDPTVLPSLVANGYAESRCASPGRTVLPYPARSGPAPGPEGIEINRSTSRARLPMGVGFDPGGIGKGLAADIVACALIRAGATAAILSIGGDVRVAGDAPAGWIVAVEDPFSPEETIGELSLVNGAVCTSSVRAKTWIHDDTPMHHLIDPRTGNPMTSSIVSATVVAGEAWLAEALCKAALTAEPVDALTFLESTGADGMLVDTNRVIWRTPGIERFAA